MSIKIVISYERIVEQMGMSASQARLLSITARLTSNEYESQQLSNAKMRLAIKSEEASSDYLKALSERQLQFVSYDAHGDKTNEDLTANAIYQYADMKNQYALVNSSGQIMVNSLDAKNFTAAANLDSFLKLYGLEKTYKTESLKTNAEKLEEMDQYRVDWENAIRDVKTSKYTINDKEVNSDEAYSYEKNIAYKAYQEAIKNYEDQLALADTGVYADVAGALAELTVAKANYTDCIDFDTWAGSKAAEKSEENGDDIYANSLKYYDVLNEILVEAKDLGIESVDKISEYEDKTKAQWYTNLWYRMNGNSSEKTPQGKNGTLYTNLDPKLANSKEWIEKALTQGIITLEVVVNKDPAKEIVNEDNPFLMKFKGIEWKPTEYGSGKDFVEVDDDTAVARAEAEYQKRNNEITAKDTKYQNKIKTLDTEHNTLQTQLDSVKSAMSKNIERSYKTFNG